jgi:hypothetical protein
LSYKYYFLLIQEFLAQMKEEKNGDGSERKADAETTGSPVGGGSEIVAVAESGETDIVAASGVQRRLANLSLPARDKPERSVRLMREQQMLQKQN